LTKDEIQAEMQALVFDLTVEVVKALLSPHDFCPVSGIVCKDCQYTYKRSMDKLRTELLTTQD
jgi:hypothetical protein